jgi:hypothetical protein
MRRLHRRFQGRSCGCCCGERKSRGGTEPRSRAPECALSELDRILGGSQASYGTDPKAGPAGAGVALVGRRLSTCTMDRSVVHPTLRPPLPCRRLARAPPRPTTPWRRPTPPAWAITTYPKPTRTTYAVQKAGDADSARSPPRRTLPFPSSSLFSFFVAPNLG